jgi:hypothetical protein
VAKDGDMMRDLATIDRALRNLSLVRRTLLEHKGSTSTRAEIVGQVDDLLDERNLLPP